MKDTAKNWFLEEINVGREERFVLPKLLVIELLLTIKRIKFFSKKKKMCSILHSTNRISVLITVAGNRLNS